LRENEKQETDSTMKIDELTNLVEITTPEGISFPFHLASPVTRCLAFTLDFFCIILIVNISSILVRFTLIISPDAATALSILLYFLISLLYGVILEWVWNGQTVGKKLFRLRVVDADGLKLSPAQVLIRNLLRMVDVLPGFYMIGGITALLSPTYQRLGDIAGRTYVIIEQNLSDPDLSSIVSDKYNSFRDYPYIAAKARSRIPPDEAALFLNAVLRRNSLSPASRTEVYSALVKYAKSKVEFPQEATDGISDERYLRNLVDILYRRQK
jgi:uncharacterized RDD family membrane protein YckC